MHPIHTIAVTAIIAAGSCLAACNSPGGSAKAAKLPTATTPPAPGADAKPAAAPAAWTSSQLQEVTDQCVAAGGDAAADDRRKAFCACIGKALAVRWPYSFYKTRKQDTYDRVVRDSGDQCAAAAQKADTGAVVTDDTANAHRWTQASIDQATSQCTGDLAKIGLQLDADITARACDCLLRGPREKQAFADFSKSLPTMVKDHLSDGGLKACLAEAKFDADKIKSRAWGKPILAGTYADGGLDRATAGIDDTGGRIGVIWVVLDPTDGPSIWARLFDKAQGGWGSPNRIEQTQSLVGTPRIVYGADGAAHAYWVEMSGTTPAVYTSTFAALWSAPTVLGNKTFTGVNGVDFTFEVAASGAIVVINVDHTNNNIVVVTQYDPTNGWGTAQALTGPAPAWAPRLALGTAGDLVAAWVAGGKLITSSLKDGKWSAPRTDGAPTVDGASVDLTIDRPDYALAAWLVVGASTTKVQASRYTGLTGWDAGAPISETANLLTPRLALSENGGGVAAWIDSSSGQKVITVATYHLFDGWAKPTPLSDPATSIDSLTLVRGGAGRAIAVWTEDTGGKAGTIWIAAFE